jgi:hypothetical protein
MNGFYDPETHVARQVIPCCGQHPALERPDGHYRIRCQACGWTTQPHLTLRGAVEEWNATPVQMDIMTPGTDGLPYGGIR